jgi:hypothetical protein
MYTADIPAGTFGSFPSVLMGLLQDKLHLVGLQEVV